MPSKNFSISNRSGKTYRYIAVPADKYQAYTESFSKGKYLNKFIKDHYKFIRLN